MTFVSCRTIAASQQPFDISLVDFLSAKLDLPTARFDRAVLTAQNAGFTLPPATISLSVTQSSTKPAAPPTQSDNPPLRKAQPVDWVPLLDLQRQYEHVRAEVLAAVGRVCASQHYILGPEVEAFEREIADFCGARDAVGCASGTDALWLALVASGVQPGDQVITTPFSFFACASAIVRAGATPVFSDIDPLTFNLDPSQIEKKLREARSRKFRALL